MSGSTRRSFESDLELLNVEMIKMSAMVEHAIENTITAFKNQDERLAEAVIAGDRDVNEAEKQIEAKCLSLILRQQPVARDLRSVSTALKMVTDIERIGDHAADIAELVKYMKGEHIFEIVEHIPTMADVAIEMVHNAVKAFVEQDLQLVKSVTEEDDVMDELFEKTKSEVVDIIRQNETGLDLCVDFLMISKYFERIGDHAVNICEWVEFGITGEYQKQRIL